MVKPFGEGVITNEDGFIVGITGDAKRKLTILAKYGPDHYKDMSKKRKTIGGFKVRRDLASQMGKLYGRGMHTDLGRVDDGIQVRDL